MSSISLHLLLTDFKHLCSDSSTAELRAAILFDAKTILIDFIQFPNELRFKHSSDSKRDQELNSKSHPRHRKTMHRIDDFDLSSESARKGRKPCRDSQTALLALEGSSAEEEHIQMHLTSILPIPLCPP